MSMTENEIIKMLEVGKAYMDSHGGRSQSEAKRNGYSQAQISKCCNGIVEHYLGYQWMFVE